MEHSILLGKVSDTELRLLSAMANRHGLIAGSTGYGKERLIEAADRRIQCARRTCLSFADVKGDLAGLALPGETTAGIRDRAKALGVPAPSPTGFPVMFWDLFGELGHPLRTTISEMGPLLLGQILGLNDTQYAVLTLVFRYADDRGLLALDLKDLRALLQHIDENRQEFSSSYGNVSTASLGAIQRGLVLLEEIGGDQFFGEPALDFGDFLQTDESGRGYINILAAEKLYQSPKMYSMSLLWLLSEELFEQLPEVGDVEKPKLVFFFDEAHLLFDDASKPLLEKIEHVVRLIRSKGVGVFFATQNPLDIPDSVLGQLGNRVQHALRAFTERDKKAVNAVAQTFRTKGEDVSSALTQLAIGEALVSCLDAVGTPVPVERTMICPPASRIGSITLDERKAVMAKSLVAGHYEKSVDRISAYEMLKNRAAPGPQSAAEEPPAQAQQPSSSSAPEQGSASTGGIFANLPPLFGSGNQGQGGYHRQTPGEAFVMSTVRAIGSQVGRQIIRGVMGSILGRQR